jgi:hypothetical protein
MLSGNIKHLSIEFYMVREKELVVGIGDCYIFKVETSS